MPGSLSNFAENSLVGHLVNTAYTPPATVYLALCTADPTDAGTGASMNETPNSNAYARTAITFSAAASRRVTQNADVNFPQATGNYAAAVTHWAIVDSATHGAGNMLAHGAFVSSFQPVTGNTPKVVTALQEVYIQINATVTGGLTNYAVHNLLNLMFRNVAFTSPAGNTFVRLSQTTLADDDVAVGDFTEVTGTDYLGKEVNPNGGAAPAWSTVSGGVVSNGAVVDFGTVPAGGWSDIVAGVIMDTVSGAGNILGYDNGMVDQTNVAENDTVSIGSGALTLTMT